MNGSQPRRRSMKPLLFAVAGLLVLAAIVLGIQQVLYLRWAHSSFENYYSFRGCASLVSRGSDFGICKLPNGQTEKIVLYQGRWFLDGDLPQCLINIGSTCLIDTP